MKKRTLFLIIFRTLTLSLILSLFSISFIAKKYDPSDAFLNYVYDTEEIITDVKLLIKVEDERDIYDYKLIKSEFLEDLTTFNTYKYINDVTDDNFTPYIFNKYGPNRRLLKIGEKAELIAGYMPYSQETHKIAAAEYYASILLYEDQVLANHNLLENGTYEDVIFQEVIKGAYPIQIGYYDSMCSDYKIAGVVKGNAPNSSELLSSLIPNDMTSIKKIEDVSDGQAILMNGFTYYMTGVYEKDIKVIRLLYEDKLEGITFSLYNSNYNYKKYAATSEKFKDNNLYVYGLILASLYVLYNLQSNIKHIKKEKSEGVINENTKLINVLIKTYLQTLIYLVSALLIATLTSLIYYLINKETLLHFSINHIVTFVIPIGIWVIYAPLNMLIYNEIMNA